MKLKKPLVLLPPKYKNSNGETITPDAIILEKLEILHINNPQEKEYYLSIKDFPNQILLFQGEFYNDKITAPKAIETLMKICEGDLTKILQKSFPRTLTNEQGQVGTIFRDRLKLNPPYNSALYQQCLVLNRRGPDWCEENFDAILEKLEEHVSEYKRYWWSPVKKALTFSIREAKKNET